VNYERKKEKGVPFYETPCKAKVLPLLTAGVTMCQPPV